MQQRSFGARLAQHPRGASDVRRTRALCLSSHCGTRCAASAPARENLLLRTCCCARCAAVFSRTAAHCAATAHRESATPARDACNRRPRRCRREAVGQGVGQQQTLRAHQESATPARDACDRTTGADVRLPVGPGTGRQRACCCAPCLQQSFLALPLPATARSESADQRCLRPPPPHRLSADESATLRCLQQSFLALQQQQQQQKQQPQQSQDNSSAATSPCARKLAVGWGSLAHSAPCAGACLTAAPSERASVVGCGSREPGRAQAGAGGRG
jgi:hypothetical protein